jgi:hypothetical protein
LHHHAENFHVPETRLVEFSNSGIVVVLRVSGSNNSNAKLIVVEVVVKVVALVVIVAVVKPEKSLAVF